MSCLKEFCEKPFESKEKLIETLERLTKECEVQANRDSLDITLFLDLSTVLTNYENLDFLKLKEASTVLAHVFRFLRNSLIHNKPVQKYMGESTSIIYFSLEFIKSKLSIPEEDGDDENLLVATRCCLQFLSNLMVDNEDNCRLISSSANETLCRLIKESNDDKILQYSAMCLHIILKLMPEWVKELDVSIFPMFFQNTHLEFVMYIFETLFENEIFLTLIFVSLESEVRVNFLKVVIAHTELHTRSSDPILKFAAYTFKAKSDLILKSKLQNDDEWICWEIASLLELLCCVTAANVFDDTSLLTTVVFLLKSVHGAGKVTDAEKNNFSPVQKLEDLRINAETEEMRSQPTFQFKAHLIRLIANLAHKNFQAQELVREVEGIAVILDCCQIDARNPFITQWAVLAIRNLCEGNIANQEFIRSVQRLDTENAVSKYNLIGL